MLRESGDIKNGLLFKAMIQETIRQKFNIGLVFLRLNNSQQFSNRLLLKMRGLKNGTSSSRTIGPCRARRGRGRRGSQQACSRIPNLSTERGTDDLHLVQWVGAQRSASRESATKGSATMNRVWEREKRGRGASKASKERASNFHDQRHSAIQSGQDLSKWEKRE